MTKCRRQEDSSSLQSGRWVPVSVSGTYNVLLGVQVGSILNPFTTTCFTSFDQHYIAIMKLLNSLPFVALSSAFLLPPEQVFGELAIEDHHDGTTGFEDTLPTKDEIVSDFKKYFDGVIETSETAWGQVSETAQNAFDEAFETASETAEVFSGKVQDAAFDVKSWLEEELVENDWLENESDGPHHGRPGRRPHHPPHHGAPNQTVWQLISKSKYTTKLAKAIGKYDDLVESLNSTEANFTIFAPTDKAFAKIPEGAPEPSKEQLKAVLSYHVVPGIHTARQLLSTHTLPTLLKSEHLGSEAKPQRLAIKITLRGLSINYYSRVVAANIAGTNGVIHGVDTLLLPPPSVITIIDLLPGEFSTLELGLGKTGLLEKLNTTDHAGGTFFAPSNFAFQKLGPKINAFLFSQYGQKYLKALLKYHVVPDNTLYSDAYYSADSSSENIPKGFFHVDLPTMLEDRKLAIDIARYGGFISMKINAFARVAVQDGIAADGVLHVVGNVLIPPKDVGDANEEGFWDGESEMSVDELKERLEPFVPKNDL